MALSAAHIFAQRLVAAAVALALTSAASGDTGKAREAAVLARILSYELTLEERAGDAVGVAVVFKKGDPASEANAEEWNKALGELSGVRVKERRFFVMKVPYDTDSLARAIEKDGVDVLLASEGLAAEVADIAKLARAKHVLTAADAVGYIEQSLTVCVTQEGGKPKIYVNLNVAQLEGIRFSSALLKLVTLVH